MRRKIYFGNIFERKDAGEPWKCIRKYVYISWKLFEKAFKSPTMGMRLFRISINNLRNRNWENDIFNDGNLNDGFPEEEKFNAPSFEKMR